MSKKEEHLAGLAINIPQTMIEDTIRAHMVAAMPNPEIWVQQICKLALDEPAKDRYGHPDRKKTVFQAAIEEMILEEAKAILAEWLAQHREMIRKALVAEMERAKGKRIRDLAKRMADGVCRGYVSSVNFKLENDD